MPPYFSSGLCATLESGLQSFKMALTALPGSGYQGPVGTSARGYPIYLYRDPRSNALHYVVVTPDNRAYYSDAHGNVGYPSSAGEDMAAGAVLGSIIGAIFGGVLGGAAGALAGAVAGQALWRKDASRQR